MHIGVLDLHKCVVIQMYCESDDAVLLKLLTS